MMEDGDENGCPPPRRGAPRIAHSSEAQKCPAAPTRTSGRRRRGGSPEGRRRRHARQVAQGSLRRAALLAAVAARRRRRSTERRLLLLLRGGVCRRRSSAQRCVGALRGHPLPIAPGSTTKVAEPVTPQNVPVDPNFVIDVWHEGGPSTTRSRTRPPPPPPTPRRTWATTRRRRTPWQRISAAAPWRWTPSAYPGHAPRPGHRGGRRLAAGMRSSWACRVARHGLHGGRQRVKALVSLCAAKAPDEATASAICTQAAGNLLAREDLQAFAFHELPKSSSDGQQDRGGCGRRQQRERQGQ